MRRIEMWFGTKGYPNSHRADRQNPWEEYGSPPLLKIQVKVKELEDKVKELENIING